MLVLRQFKIEKHFSDRRTHVKHEMALQGTMRSQQVMNNKLIKFKLRTSFILNVARDQPEV